MAKRKQPPKGGSSTKRGEVFQVTTIGGLLDWHHQNVRELQKSWGGDPVKAACWFAAYTEAETMVDSNTTKDWAEVIQGGLPRLDNSAALATWLMQWVDGFDGDLEGAQTEMLRLLQLFWLTDRDGSPSVQESEE